MKLLPAVVLALTIACFLRSKSASANSCELLFTPVPEARIPLLSDWLSEKYVYLANDYRKPSGQYCVHCNSIAMEAAALLLKQNKAPLIYAFAGQVIDTQGNNATLVPLRYNGRVTWGGHQVAVADGIVYDPMIGKPVELSSYPRIAFGVEKLVIDDIMGTEKILEFLGRVSNEK